jgi:hypothetical protein
MIRISTNRFNFMTMGFKQLCHQSLKVIWRKSSQVFKFSGTGQQPADLSANETRSTPTICPLRQPPTPQMPDD